MLTLDQLANFEHYASAGIMLAAESGGTPSSGLLVIAVAAAAVAVAIGRALARLLAVIAEAWRLAIETAGLALRLVALLAGVLVMLSVSVMQLLPI